MAPAGKADAAEGQRCHRDQQPKQVATAEVQRRHADRERQVKTLLNHPLLPQKIHFRDIQLQHP